MALEWSDTLEKLIKQTGEKSLCYSILHRRSQSYYAYYNHFIAIPIIALSAVTGAATFSLGGTESALASIILGSLSVITGFIQTLGSYFRFAALSENHRIVSIQYDKLYQMISTQLAIAREIREPAHKIMDSIKDSIERLSEVAPEIPPYVINGFKQDYKQYTDISRPNIVNGLDPIQINVEPPVQPRPSIPSVTLPTPPPELPLNPPEPPASKIPVGRPWK
jgi:hypothetical protein